MNTFVATIDPALAQKIHADLTTQGFEFSHPPYTIFSAKKSGISFTLYSSGKITVQGKNKDDFIAFYLEPEILQNLSYTHPELEIDLSPHIGSDEAGKGDLFGPLCIAAVYADETIIRELHRIGVKDSKKLADASTIALAKQISNLCQYHVVRIFPQKYNDLYQTFQNLNHLLAWGHATAISQVIEKTTCTKILIDQFTSQPLVAQMLKRKNVQAHVTQRTKAESDPVVAAASILARAAFVEGMEVLSREAGMTLPKGASAQTIEVAKRLVQEKGREHLGSYVKLHFKTTALF